MIPGMNRNERAEDVMESMLTDWLKRQGWVPTYSAPNDEAVELAFMNTLPTRGDPSFLIVTLRIEDPS